MQGWGWVGWDGVHTGLGRSKWSESHLRFQGSNKLWENREWCQWTQSRLVDLWGVNLCPRAVHLTICTLMSIVRANFHFYKSIFVMNAMMDFVPFAATYKLILHAFLSPLLTAGYYWTWKLWRVWNYIWGQKLGAKGKTKKAPCTLCHCSFPVIRASFWGKYLFFCGKLAMKSVFFDWVQ